MQIRKIAAFSVLVSFLFVNSGFAATTAAVLNSAGNVQVNGRYVPATTPVFAGDRVETTEKSTGTVSFADTSLQIEAGSGVVFGNESLELIKGGATVRTAKAYKATVHGLSIRPEVNASEFMIHADASKVTISALKGSLSIGSHIRLPQGKTLVLAATATPTQGTNCIDGHKADANGKLLLDAQGRFINCVEQNATGGTPVNTISDNTTKWAVISLAVAGGVGGATAAAIAANDKDPVSPAVP
jgi:hypothetical protein